MTRWDRTGAAALAAAMTIGTVALSGCGGGGGGGGGGGSTGPTNYTITGTLLNSGAADPGITIKFDANSAISAVTDSSGKFTLTVPKSAITGSDYVAIYTGSTPVTKAVTETAGVPQNLGTIDVGTTVPTTYTVTGTILNSGAPDVGITVKFDNNSAISAVTDVNGKFTLTIPKSAITGSDYVAIVIVTGSAPVTQPITETAGVPQNLGTIDVGGLPPPPPI